MMRFRPFVFCLAAAATIAASLWPWLGGEYRHEQFVVGTISLRGDNKAVDYQAAAIVIAAFLALAWLYQQLIQRLRGVADAESAIEQLLGLALLPLAAWLGIAVVRNVVPEFPSAWALAATTMLAYFAWLARTTLQLDCRAISGLGGQVLLGLLLSYFAGAAGVLLVVQLSGHAWPASMHAARNCIALAVAINALVMAAMFARARDPQALAAALRTWLVHLQFALPLLGLVLLPPQVLWRGALEPVVGSWPLVVLVAAYAAWAWVRLARRLGHTVDDASGLDGTLDAAALAMLAVFLTSPHAAFDLLSAPGYPTLFGDDFHMGEQILPWQQWIDFHRTPYVDFAPVHGLMPLLTGALDALFFDGTLANFLAAYGILVALSAIATLLLACRTAGAGVGLVLCFVLSSFDRLLFLAPALLLLADAKLLSRPVSWVAVWSVAVTFMVGYNAAVGLALAGGTAPVALWMLVRALRQPESPGVALAALAALAAGGLLLIGLVPPVREVVAGFVRFIAENSEAGVARHGVPFARGLLLPGNPADGVLASRVLFELFRLSWLAVAVFALHRAFGWRRQRRHGGGTGTLLLPLMAGLSLVLLAAWSMGRIDAEYTSRIGAVSFLAVGTLLPILCLQRDHPSFATSFSFALAVAVFMGMVSAQERLSPNALAQRAMARVEAPAALERVTANEFGGRRLGTLFIPSERKRQIASFDAALQRVLAPGQTYFDFTNRQAFYFYRDRPVPALYSATYNAISELQQERMLRQLVADPPAAVLVAPAMAGDGVDASLRSYFLFRHFLRGYRPVAVGPWTFLVSERSPAYPAAVDSVRDDDLLERAFPHADLQWLPATWGSSWKALEAKAKRIGEFLPVSQGSASASRCSAEDAGLLLVSAGRFQLADTTPIDLLEIRLRVVANPPSLLLLEYRPQPAGRTRAITMRVRGDRLIVPVGSFPSWLRSAGTPLIELCVAADSAPSADLIAGVRAWSIPELTNATGSQVTKAP
jgi:hypothetical protein